MKKNELFFLSRDNQTNIHMVMWEPEGKIYGVIQVVHGMTEHIMRYEEFANYLNKGGIAVVGIDLLGHGMSTNNGTKKMYFGPEGSWKLVVDDLDTCFQHTKELYPDVPYVMMGFSLGSFLARTYLIDYPGKVDGAILVGTGQMGDFLLQMARKIAVKEGKKYGEASTTEKIKKLTFGTYNKKFKPNRTDYDWLCASTTSLDQYIADPLRGEAMSCGLFRELLDGMKYTASKNNMKKMNLTKPVLFLSGKSDPVGDFGKGVDKAYRAFQSVGVLDVSVKMYDGLRHDILHEDNRYSIYDDIYGWLHSKVLRSVPVLEDEIALDAVKENEMRYANAVQKAHSTPSVVKESSYVEEMLKQQQKTLNVAEEVVETQNEAPSSEKKMLVDSDEVQSKIMK